MLAVESAFCSGCYLHEGKLLEKLCFAHHADKDAVCAHLATEWTPDKRARWVRMVLLVSRCQDNNNAGMIFPHAARAPAREKASGPEFHWFIFLKSQDVQRLTSSSPLTLRGAPLSLPTPSTTAHFHAHLSISITDTLSLLFRIPELPSICFCFFHNVHLCLEREARTTLSSERPLEMAKMTPELWIL